MAKEGKGTLYKKLKRLFFQPSRFFSEIEHEKSYTPIMFFYVKVFLVALIVQLILQIITLFTRASVDTSIILNLVNLLLSSIISVGLAFAYPFVWAVLVHLGVLIFRGKQGFFNTYKPIAYASSISLIYNLLYNVIAWPAAMIGSSGLNLEDLTPDMLLQNKSFLVLVIIYVIIMAISLINVLYVSVLGLSRFQKFSKRRALFATIIIPLVLLILVVIAFFVWAYYGGLSSA